MKINKFNEDIETKKFSDLENWSVADNKNKKIYSGNKEFNYELGNKVIELLNEYGLGIIAVGPGKWLEKNKLILSDETNLKEYRVNIGKKQDWDDFIEEYNDENDIEYDDLDEEQQEKVQEIYNNLPYKGQGYGDDDYIEFSVFLPNNVKDVESAAMSDASTYLKLLVDSGFELYGGGLDEYDVFYHEPIPTKNFINGKKITINNNNLEDIVSISYRLYKDGKVFDSFREFLDDNESTAKAFFNEWLKLIK
jgi:hypothetical protein